MSEIQLNNTPAPEDPQVPVTPVTPVTTEVPVIAATPDVNEKSSIVKTQIEKIKNVWKTGEPKEAKILIITGGVFAVVLVVMLVAKIGVMIFQKPPGPVVPPSNPPPVVISTPGPRLSPTPKPTVILTNTQQDLEAVRNDLMQLNKEDSRFEQPLMIFDLKLK